MALRNTSYSYGSVAKFFHWLIFLLIAGMVAVGFIMTDMEKTPTALKIYGMHKSVGITILSLASLRLLWKLSNTTPLLPIRSRIEYLAAKGGHALLYVLMFAMPLSGWAMSSAAGLKVSVFGLFVLPDLVAPDKILKGDFVDLHGALAWALIIVVSLHVMAALLHHFYFKDDILRRMLPFVKPRREKNARDTDTPAGC